MSAQQSHLAVAVQHGAAQSEDLLQRLVACPSETGATSRIMDLLEPELRELAFDVEMLSILPGALSDHPEYSPPGIAVGEQPPALHARYRGQEPGDPSLGDLMLFAHTDTEPELDGWGRDPHALILDQGRAYGLGVADDKAGVVSILAAVRAVQEAGLELTRLPRVVLGSGKQGGALGTLPGTLAAEGVAAAVYCHPAESGQGLSHLKVASRGVVQLEVTVPGLTAAPSEVRTPVSADPREGRNAIIRAARLATALTANKDDDLVREVTALAGRAGAFEVPDIARFVVGCWFTAGDIGSVVSRSETMLAAMVGDDWEALHPPGVQVVGTRANPATCAGTAFAEWAAEVISETTAGEVVNYDWHSASDIRFPMRCLGVPAVGFGALAGGFYGPGEWVDIASMHTTTEVLARMLTAQPQR